MTHALVVDRHRADIRDGAWALVQHASFLLLVRRAVNNIIIHTTTTRLLHMVECRTALCMPFQVALSHYADIPPGCLMSTMFNTPRLHNTFLSQTSGRPKEQLTPVYLPYPLTQRAALSHLRSESPATGNSQPTRCLFLIVSIFNPPSAFPLLHHQQSITHATLPHLSANIITLNPRPWHLFCL